MSLVSICIPTYNCERYLPQAIDSVLMQNFADLELVICDDGSTDNTQGICAAYRDPRIRYIRLSQKSGQAGNFNRCIDEARGKYLTILHADDYLLPGFISDRVACLEACPHVGFVFGAVENVDADGKSLGRRGSWAEDRTFQDGELLPTLLHGCCVSPPTLMVRAAAARAAGPFRRDLTWGHDWEWAMRLAEQYGSQYTAQPLAAYRVHEASGTVENLNAAKNGPQERRILELTLARIRAKNPRAASLRRSVFQALSYRHMYFAEQGMLDGLTHVARHNLWYALLADSRILLRPGFWLLLIGTLLPLSLYKRWCLIRNCLKKS